MTDNSRREFLKMAGIAGLGSLVAAMKPSIFLDIFGEEGDEKIERRRSDPSNPREGQMWLREDLIE